VVHCAVSGAYKTLLKDHAMILLNRHGRQHRCWKCIYLKHAARCMLECSLIFLTFGFHVWLWLRTSDTIQKFGGRRHWL